MDNMFFLSNTKLQTYLQCPLKYKFQYVDYLGKEFRMKKPYLGLGTSIHAALANFFAISNPAERTLEKLKKLLRINWDRSYYKSIEEERLYGTRALYLLDRFYDNNDMLAKPVFIEKGFKLKLRNFILTGFIDRVDKLDNGNYEIIDYKTGKRVYIQEELDEDLQLTIYAIALREKFNMKADKVSLYLLENCEKVTSTRNDEDIDKTIDYLEEMTDTILNDTRFEPKRNQFCTSCDFAIICPLMGIVPSKSQDQKDLEQRLDEVIKIVLNLNKAAGDISSVLNEHELVELIMKTFISFSDARKGSLMLINEKENCLKIVASHKIAPKKRDRAVFKKGEGICGKVAENGEPINLVNIKDDPNYIDLHEPDEDSFGEESILCIPLKHNNKVFGVINLNNKMETVSFPESDLIVLGTLAAQSAIAIDNARLYKEMREKQKIERDIEIASNIQRSLVPSVFPEFNGVDYYAYTKAAKLVGGDYFDILKANADNIVFIISDVAGKGVAAGLVMVKIQTVIHSNSTQYLEPEKMINKVNKHLCEMLNQEKYATLSYNVFNTQTKILKYGNAGHSPLLIYRAVDDSFLRLDSDGMPVGLFEENNYNSYEVELSSGDIIFDYTDGITEAMNINRIEFGEQRIEAIIRENRDKQAKDIQKILVSEIKNFVGTAPQHDDMTFIIVKIK